MQTDHDETIKMFLSRRDDWSEHDMVDAVLSNLAARSVEELRVVADNSRHPSAEYYSDVVGLDVGFYKISIGSLPSDALRVLHIMSYNGLKPAPPPGAAFLRLHVCAVSLEVLQGMIDAAPQLTTLQLDSVFLAEIHDPKILHEDEGSSPPPVRWSRLRCPAVTALVLANCDWGWGVGNDGSRMELDVPRMPYFRYKGLVRPFSLKSKAPDMARVDLHFANNVDYQTGQNEAHVPFWQFVQNFSNAKIMKLKLD